MKSAFSKKLLEVAKRKRAERESPHLDRLPSGTVLPEAADDPEPPPVHRRGQRIWSLEASIVAKVSLSLKAFWMKVAREYKVEGGQAGLLSVVLEFLKEHPVVLAMIVLWHKRRERALRKERR